MHKTCTKCGEIKLVAEFNKRKKLRDGLRSECKMCQKEYFKKYREANSDREKERVAAYFKSNPGYQAAWRKVNSEKYKARTKKYKKDHPEPNREYSRKRRALKIGAYHEPYKDIDIFERDGWICGICGTKINKRLKWPHPRSKSIDHVIALSNGGADVPINLQSAHLRCNISKSAGNSGQLRLFG